MLLLLMRETDVAVVGAGIVGLAFALAHASRGRKVTVFERTDFSVGASVRNFGLIWPVGQRFGPTHDRAMRSREIWLEVIKRAELWHAPTGSLHLAYADDEFAVLSEYARVSASAQAGRRLIGPSEAASHGAVHERNLKGALFSPTEINIDPRQALRKIPLMLQQQFDVNFQFGLSASHISSGRITTSDGEWKANESSCALVRNFRACSRKNLLRAE
jgi:D-hydroxyproline dehydrogenase subunit beta